MNKVILIGNLTRDVEISETQSGVKVCHFSLAVARDYTSDGKRETDFLNITAWRKTAELCAQYLKKGNKCAIVGTLQNRIVEDGKGDRKTYTEIIASDVEFLTPKAKEETEIESVKKPETRPSLEPVDDNSLPF